MRSLGGVGAVLESRQGRTPRRGVPTRFRPRRMPLFAVRLDRASGHRNCGETFSRLEVFLGMRSLGRAPRFWNQGEAGRLGEASLPDSGHGGRRYLPYAFTEQAAIVIVAKPFQGWRFFWGGDPWVGPRRFWNQGKAGRLGEASLPHLAHGGRLGEASLPDLAGQAPLPVPVAQLWGRPPSLKLWWTGKDEGEIEGLRGFLLGEAMEGAETQDEVHGVNADHGPVPK